MIVDYTKSSLGKISGGSSSLCIDQSTSRLCNCLFVSALLFQGTWVITFSGARPQEFEKSYAMSETFERSKEAYAEWENLRKIKIFPWESGTCSLDEGLGLVERWILFPCKTELFTNKSY